MFTYLKKPLVSFAFMTMGLAQSLSADSQTLLKNAQTLVQNVAFNSNTLYTASANGKQLQYNTYSYGYVKNGTGSNLGDYSVPKGFSSPVFSDSDNKSGYPFIGTVDNKYISVTDCSGLVSYLVKQTSADAYNELINLTKGGTSHSQPWPSAAQFALLAKNAGNAKYWTSVGYGSGLAAQLSKNTPQPGDILAWQLPSGQDTGHVMVIQSWKAGAGSDMYQLQVIDSSNIRHIGESSSAPIGATSGTISLKYDSKKQQWLVGLGSPASHSVNMLSVSRMK